MTINVLSIIINVIKVLKSTDCFSYNEQIICSELNHLISDLAFSPLAAPEGL